MTRTYELVLGRPTTAIIVIAEPEPFGHSLLCLLVTIAYCFETVPERQGGAERPRDPRGRLLLF